MIQVAYQGGQSRYGAHAVDFMQADVDGTELYAELEPGDGETDTYEALKTTILEMGAARGIAADRLRFCYDE